MNSLRELLEQRVADAESRIEEIFRERRACRTPLRNSGTWWTGLLAEAHHALEFHRKNLAEHLAASEQCERQLSSVSAAIDSALELEE